MEPLYVKLHRHRGVVGTFYSSWADSRHRGACRETNKATYRTLAGLLDVAQVAQPETRGTARALTYRKVGGAPTCETFEVLERPSWLSMDEAALVIDGGSLFNGHTTFGNHVVIFRM